MTDELGVKFEFESFFSGEEGGSTGGSEVDGVCDFGACDLLLSASLASSSSSLDYVSFIILIFGNWFAIVESCPPIF